MVQYWSKSLPALAEFGAAFYPYGRKLVPRDMIMSEELSDAALAVWFMDDGSTTIHNGRDALHPYCQIATNGFTDDDVKWLCSYLTDIGLPCSDKSSSGNTGSRIHFTKDGSQALVERIARFVPPSMRYKVGHLNNVAKFDPDSWGNGKSDVTWDFVTISRQSHKSWEYCNTVYCLTIEGDEQNFVAGPVVVHNCEQDIKEVGYRYHMTDDQAVVGIENLPYAQKAVVEARMTAAWYYEHLKNVNGITVPPFDPTCNYWLFSLIIHEDRDGFIERMAEQGVATGRVHARNDTHTAFKAASVHGKPLPGVDYFDDHQVNIPIGWWLKPGEREHIVAAIVKSLKIDATLIAA